jgi:hypothetical protein
MPFNKGQSVLQSAVCMTADSGFPGGGRRERCFPHLNLLSYFTLEIHFWGQYPLPGSGLLQIPVFRGLLQIPVFRGFPLGAGCSHTAAGPPAPSAASLLFARPLQQPRSAVMASDSQGRLAGSGA